MATAPAEICLPCWPCGRATRRTGRVARRRGYLLTNQATSWFLGLYLGPDDDPKNPSLSPHFTDDLSGVADAFIITAEFDPLRDEGEAYAARLRDSGVAVDLNRYDGMVHGFFQMGGVTPVADAAVSEAASHLRAALS